MNSLTKKESEIFNLVTLGFETDEIAEKLHISDYATRFYMSNIYKKLKRKMHNNSNMCQCIRI